MRFNLWQKAILATTVAQILWGIGGPLVKVALEQIPPFGFMFLRFLVTCLILFPYFEIKIAKTQPKFSREDLKDLILAGVFGVFANIALYFWGQNLTTITDAWIITATGAPIVLVYSFIFLKERLPKPVYLGIFLSFLGSLSDIDTPFHHV